MVMLEHSRHRTSLSSRCWSAAIVLVICSLAVSVATRFTVLSPSVQKSTTAKCDHPDAKRQHLRANAVRWTAPAIHFALYQPPRPSVLTVSAVIPSTNLTSETWLYNRPPPCCCPRIFCSQGSSLFSLIRFRSSKSRTARLRFAPS
jgi:hypothetical protein